MTRFLAVLVAVSALVTPTPAEASEPRVTLVVAADSAHDVVQVPRACPATGCPPPKHGQSRPAADITSISAEYGPALNLTAQVRGIGRRVSFTWLIRGPGRNDHYAALVKRRGKVSARFFDVNGEPVPCEELVGNLDTEHYLATLEVPSSCFDSPTHVRVGLLTAAVRGIYHVFFDDALRDRFDPYRVPNPRLSERLDRI